HTFNRKERREHKETADQTQIGNFSAFFVISVVKNQATFGTAANRQGGTFPLRNKVRIGMTENFCGNNGYGSITLRPAGKTKAPVQ
ncbi:MAG: hypothetical protein WAW03_10700, partial [Anaerolineae bacterium]